MRGYVSHAVTFAFYVVLVAVLLFLLAVGTFWSGGGNLW